MRNLDWLGRGFCPATPVMSTPPTSAMPTQAASGSPRRRPARAQPVVFIHELAGDMRNWEPQVQAFSGRHRCLTYNARGYPPSDVPSDPLLYSQALAIGDLRRRARGTIGVDRAHVVGLSMGGYAALNFALAHPDKTLSVVAAGTGHGSDPDTRDEFLAGTAALADRIESLGLEVGGHDYLHGPTRRRFREKHPDGLRHLQPPVRRALGPRHRAHHPWLPAAATDAAGARAATGPAGGPDTRDRRG